MNNCDCKHSGYCKIDINTCTLESEFKHFNEDKILNRTSEEISSMQGRPNKDLKQK